MAQHLIDAIDRNGLDKIEPDVTDAAFQVMEQRYFIRDENSKIIEDPLGMYSRVAGVVDKPNRKYGYSHEDEYYGLMSTGTFIPNSPCLMNAGTDFGVLTACFVQGMEDKLLGPGSIMDCKHRAMSLQNQGGGVGYNFSKIREKGSPVRGNPGAAKGPVSVLYSINYDMRMMLQGAKRPPANMGILNIDHPDIKEFIAAKADPEALDCFNISVGISDAFMEAVQRDGGWQLKSRYNGEITETVRAKELFDLVADNSIKYGDPGFIFIDRMNRDNPSPHLGDIECTNPCGEVPLLPNEACCIGSINLFKFVTNDDKFDYDGLARVVEMATEFLDNVITMSEFPFEEVAWMMENNRKLGLGFMGFADALSAMGIRYGSDDSYTFAHKISHILRQHSYSKSEEMGRERGKATWLNRRNATTMCIAPTGTIAMFANCSYSIEPHFMVVHIKDVMRERGNFPLVMVSPSFRRAMNNLVDANEFKRICEDIAEEGHLDVPGVPEEIKDIFPGAYDVNWKDHLKMQAVFQDYVDLAVSKTINLPMDFDTDRIKNEVYINAWRWGLKGVTYYKQGSKNDVIKVGMKNYNKEIDPACIDGACSI